MDDIAPDLLEKIKNEFQQRMKEDELLKSLKKKLQAGAAAHEDAYEYANRVGEILAEAYRHHISAETLPEGKLWYNIASRVITPTMQTDRSLIAEYVTAVQNSLNQAAGLGIKAVQPEIGADRITDLINRISSEDSYADIAWILQEPVKTYSREVVDESIKANVEQQGKLGLVPKVIRRTSGRCCEWCSRLAGSYDYPEVPKDVYRRHNNCKCVVEFDPGSGKRKNVWTKKWKTEEEKAILKERKQVGMTTVAEQIMAHPVTLASFTPETLKAALEADGYEVKPLGNGNFKGIPFEKGGGFRVSFGGDRYIQYHPAARSHHGGAYYKISSGQTGKRRYKTNGDEKHD